MIKQFIFLILISGFALSCKKEIISNDPSHKLSFSTDTLTFDTVFTQMGSATRRFMIYNPNAENLIISEIKLTQTVNAQFRLNVDGIAGKQFQDVEIKANDSLFVFAEVTIDPSIATNPFILFEKVEFITNGNKQEVVLEAWGQDAYYYRPNLFINGLPPISHVSDYPQYYPVGSTVNLPNDKPHVIYGFLMVDSAMTLNVAEGTQFHFFNGAGMWAYRGSTLNINGTQGNEVVFQGTRLEDYFDDKPGQWDRIILNEGPTNHQINYAIIKNGFIGIQAEEFYLDGQPQLATNQIKILNSTIQNSEGLGILARNHNLIIENTVISNSGSHLMAFQGAGTHYLRHSTLANFWPFGSRSDELLVLSNYFLIPTTSGNIEVAGDFNLAMDNCILYGTNEEELFTDSVPAAQFIWKMTNCVLKSKRDTNELGRFENIIQNPIHTDFTFNNPLFTDPSNFDFTLHVNSPAINFGDPLLTDTLLIDLAGNTRDAFPDLGALEFIP